MIPARRAIESLALVSCHLAHERVRIEDGAPVRVGDGGAAFRRIPLCPAATRRSRLACGHTLARVEARRAIEALASGGALNSDDATRFCAELDAIGHAIELLDHRKGDAERDRAIATEIGPAAVETADAAIRALAAEHDRAVERLRDWRARLLAAIDAAP